MERNQLIVAVVALALLILSMTLLVVTRDAEKAAGGLDATERFAAKPGTTRENAIILTSQRPEAKEREASSESGRSDSPRIHSLSPVASSASSDVENLVAQELNSMSVEDAILHLEQALQQPELSEDEQALLHSGLARLYLLKLPPDYPRADLEFAEARRLAPTRERLLMVAELDVRQLMARGELEDARQVAEEVLAEAAPPSLEAARLALALAQIHYGSGRAAEAEARYEEAVEAAFKLPADEGTAAVIRHGGAQLTRLLRERGDQQAAELLTLRVRQRLLPASAQ